MQSFNWDPCFVTGLDSVDEQHHYLVDIINQLADLLTQPQGPKPDELEQALGELQRYARYHFSEEEAFMVECHLDARHLAHHQSEHAQFLDDLLHMHAEVSASNLDRAKSLLGFLTNWLTYHILGTDQLMAALMKAKKSGTSAEEAYAAFQGTKDPATATLLQAMKRLFNHVSERSRALFDLNQTLEARVAERTLELSALNQRLEAMAMTDVLTGLPNRRHALLTLEREWRGSKVDGSTLACMMIDADGLKKINDNFGHDAGDEVLRQLALCLRRAVRNDDIVCRLGGDEFLIICTDTPLEGAMLTAEKIRRDVSLLRVPAGSGLWHGSISIGVAASAPTFNGVEHMLIAADQSLYAAKAHGRNCVASIQCTANDAT